MKTILITGAAGNLGKACAFRLAQDGHRVIGTLSPGKREPYSAERISFVNADLRDEEAVRETIAGIVATQDRLDAVVLTAGGFSAGGLAGAGTKDLQRMIDLNFITAYNVARQAFHHMKDQKGGGRIVFVGSKPGLSPAEGTGAVAYTLSKALLVPLAELLNEQGKKFNVRTSIVAPATIDTPENRAAMPGSDTSSWIRPEALADLIASILSPAYDAAQNVVIKAYG